MSHWRSTRGGPWPTIFLAAFLGIAAIKLLSFMLS